MSDAIAREMLYAARYRWPPWVTDREPPSPGWYLLRVAIQDDDVTMLSVRLDHWTGSIWDTLGGYCEARGWMERPAV